jgi:acetyl-CoA acetyltransferase family protein
MQDAFIIDAVRTPIGRYGGALADVRPDDLAAHVIAAAVERNGIDGELIEDVIFGGANQAGEDNRNVARMASLIAGLPVSVPGVTVNRLCASGMEAVNQAARAIRVGDADLILAGGVESMTRAPFVHLKPDKRFPRGPIESVDTTIGWRFINPRLAERYSTEGMGETAENVAERYEVTRADQDKFALASHQRAVAAWEAGTFAREVVPVEVPNGKAGPVLVERDEGPREDTDLERLAKLKPVFREGGTVTAGNASQINDGAACVVVASEKAAERLGKGPASRPATSTSSSSTRHSPHRSWPPCASSGSSTTA